MIIKYLAISLILTFFSCPPCMAEEKALTCSDFHTSGSSAEHISSFTLTARRGVTWMDMDMPSNCGPIKFSAKVDSSLLAQVQKIIERHKVMEWDGFRGKPNLEILDGNSCGLSAVYASGKRSVRTETMFSLRTTAVSSRISLNFATRQ